MALLAEKWLNEIRKILSGETKTTSELNPVNENTHTVGLPTMVDAVKPASHLAELPDEVILKIFERFPVCSPLPSVSKFYSSDERKHCGKVCKILMEWKNVELEILKAPQLIKLSEITPVVDDNYRYHSDITLSVKSVSLENITSDQFTSLIRLIASSALANLDTLYLDGNGIDGGGMAAFAEALKPTPMLPTGTLGGLKRLDLNQNKIGSEGMIAFSSIASGALANLKELWLSSNSTKSLKLAIIANRQNNMTIGCLERLIGNDVRMRISHPLRRLIRDQIIQRLISKTCYTNIKQG